MSTSASTPQDRAAGLARVPQGSAVLQWSSYWPRDRDSPRTAWVRQGGGGGLDRAHAGEDGGLCVRVLDQSVDVWSGPGRVRSGSS